MLDSRRSVLAPMTPLQTLRRSPRFQPQNIISNPIIQNPKTPKPKSTLRTTDDPLGEHSAHKVSILRSGLRRSPRLNQWVGGSQPLRRSPRFSGSRSCEVSVDKGNAVAARKGALGGVEKDDRLNEASVRKCGFKEDFVGECGDKGEAVEAKRLVLGNVEKDRGLSEAVLRKCGDKGKGNIDEEGEGLKSEGIKGKVRVSSDGVIGEIGRKREVDDEESDVGCQGWTKEQEAALEKAYFEVLPTPRFWKKVSKMVPGKSAQDCFDKINSGHATPVQRPPRSRARKTKTSSPAFSASKLLAPNHSKNGKVGCNRKGNHLAHKAVRELLEKQCRFKESHEVDLFSELEPDVDQPIKTSQAKSHPATPNHIQPNLNALREGGKTKSSGHRNPLSSINSLIGNDDSPAVLKQVKNKALHYKYIDVLHKRDAKRKALAAKEEKLLTGKENKKGCYMPNIDVRAAKNALISGASDAISQLKGLHDNAKENSSELDYDLQHDEDEDEV